MKRIRKFLHEKSLNTIITFILYHVDLRFFVPIKDNQAQQATDLLSCSTKKENNVSSQHPKQDPRRKSQFNSLAKKMSSITAFSKNAFCSDTTEDSMLQKD